MGAAGRPRTVWLVVTVLVILFALLPLLVVSIASGPEDGSFPCRVEVVEDLATTQEGKLRFLLVRTLEGRGLGDLFVVTVDRDYTLGLPGALRSGGEFWLEGTPMDRETFFGEQYLFFGYPQLYVSQVKTGLRWPTQLNDLRTLYMSPVSSVASLYLIGAFPFMEEFAVGEWLLIVARAVAVVCAGVLAVRWRKRRARVVVVLGAYLVVAVLLSTAGLPG